MIFEYEHERQGVAMIEHERQDIPAPSSFETRPRKSRHGRVPKDQRGNRDQRLRGRILDSLHNGRRVTTPAR